ncbi:putative coniferyl aldehyde dehydrogenase [Desulfamplus magnetovallimortis]|uniref:Aldehyde dehydrogenase n=1 Tax=Desulfamplus magnetovallimortis TaxID=1246637 RepID=A0A1W1H8W4_9BACT|nr:coniferyl aldehyde dehydrogenase [Desulfamplus magnetovallimortis]SLM28874.1 putative coniferyl aldehyde dehydrogenase [Desulfamplus magnetovallimortis]
MIIPIRKATDCSSSQISGNTEIMEIVDSSPLDKMFNAQKAAFMANPMPSAKERISHLKTLENGLMKYRKKLTNALDDDFGCRSEDESLLAEIIPAVENIRYIRKHVKKWMKPSPRKVGMLFQPAKAMVIYQPLGVVGIITPWNYPLYLSVGPLAGILGAGNRSMIRMSKNTPATADVLKNMFQEFFDEDHVTVMTGDEGSGSAFSGKPWDHLVFTGSTEVGRLIMRAASSNLTPVTLELGGKTPAIINDKFPMKEAVLPIAFGKIFNMGQTCVAPDHVLCPRLRINEFVEHFKKSVKKMFPTMLNNPQYTSIINSQEYERLQEMVADARSKGAEIISVNPAGENFENTRKMPVTLILNTTDEMKVMQEEIFGPLLPILPCDSLHEAVNFVNNRPRPLALYYFDYNQENIDYVLTHTHSGGVLINDTLAHVPQDDLPFGGIGESGMGQYHGHEGFLAFSKAKGVMMKSRINSGKLVYPPYGNIVHRLAYKLFLK